MKYLVLLLTLSLLGCSTFYPGPESPRTARPLPENIKKHLQPPENFDFNLLASNKNSETWQVVSSDLSLQFSYYSRPARKPRALVIIFNILKDTHQNVSGWIASNLISAGYNCIIIEQEDFLYRKRLRPILPAGIGLSDWNAYFGQNLRHLGLIIYHWLPNRQDLSGRYSFVGVSMGGILTVGAAACFPDAQVSIAVMAGGGNYEVLSTSQETLVSSSFERLVLYYQEQFSLSPDQAKARIKFDVNSLDFNVLELASSINTHRFRQIISLYDTSVPTETQWNLHHALGGPEARAYPSGHISLGIFAWSVRDQITHWIQQANPPLNHLHQ